MYILYKHLYSRMNKHLHCLPILATVKIAAANVGL